MYFPKCFRNIKYTIFFLNIILINPVFETKSLIASSVSNKPNSEYLKKFPKNLFYILGPGDGIFMKVSEDLPELDNSFVIDGEGTITINRLNRIYVSGLTIRELTDILNVEFKKFVFEPNVDLRIIQYRPVKIFLSGEVENPGLHILEGARSPIGSLEKARSPIDTLEKAPSPIDTFENSNSQEKSKNQQINNSELTRGEIGLSTNIFFPTVIDALRKAGGVTLYSDLENIEITRIASISEGGGRVTTNINIIDSLNLKDVSQNIRILDGDTVKVNRTNIPAIKQISEALRSNINPKFINVALAGRVESPGPLRINKSASLNDAIGLGGGLKVLGGKIKFIRYESNGTVDQRIFAYKRNAPRGNYKNPYLRNGDVIIVGKGILNNTNEVLGEITSPFQGVLSTYGMFKVITD